MNKSLAQLDMGKIFKFYIYFYVKPPKCIMMKIISAQIAVK